MGKARSAPKGDSGSRASDGDRAPIDRPLRVGVVGVGAVGLALATALHRAGDVLHLFARPTAVEKDLFRNGFRRRGRFGAVDVPANAFSLGSDLAAIPALGLDALLVCTKTTATAEVMAPLAAALRALPDPPDIVICHNGWGSAERFAAEIDSRHVFSARVITGFRRTSASEVEITVHAAPISIGSLFGVESRRIARLCADIDRGGIPCEPSTDIAAELLEKLLYNALLNPLGALTGVNYGALGDSAKTRALMNSIAAEIFAVIDGAGLHALSSDAETYLERFYAELLPVTAEHESSMLQDLRAGRPTEIDSICGAVERLGAKHSVPTPLCSALQVLVRAAEARVPGVGAR